MADDLSVGRGAGPDRLPFVADDSRAAAPWRPKCGRRCGPGARLSGPSGRATGRSEEHTSELQSLMRISYAVFCLKKKKKQENPHNKTLYPNRSPLLHHTENRKYKHITQTIYCTSRIHTNSAYNR